MDIKFGKGRHMLYRYLPAETMKKKYCEHPDPLFDELTYGEGGGFSDRVRNNVLPGSHIFFHTTIGGQRYIMAHYFVKELVEGYDARHDDKIRENYKNVHIHPENYPEWWMGDYDPELEDEDETNDIIIFGDEKMSLGKLENPVPFDRYLAEKLEFEPYKKITFDIYNKNGKLLLDSERITSATRNPRFITENDVRTILYEIELRNNDVKFNSPQHTKNTPQNKTRFDVDVSEKQIETSIFVNPSLLGNNMKIVSRQLVIPSGRIDLLLETEGNELLILEIKKGFPNDSVITQVLSYKADIENMYPEKVVKLAILCEDCSSKVKNAANASNIAIYNYGHFFEVVPLQ
ncbi:endonuclease NucS domain-containing protein [uncultured Methanolobus sp.]|uniref:endonuclease NucS domain-containing protein n=1 Tax=uncultured Methanolobus sp. TaxID=218300 RepID=UPI0029C6E868|nr:endonuclease NucS domain-containing protein [uncultured Methanolobus sp.]